MSKIVALVRSESGIATEADRAAAWPLIEQTARTAAADRAALTGLVLSRVVKPFVDEDPTIALVAAWGDDLDAEDLLQQLLPQQFRADAHLTVHGATCSEIVFRRVQDFARDGSTWTIKLAGTAFRRDDFEPDAFFDYWTNVHAPIGGHLPGLGGYTVSRALTGSLGEESADAIIEQWYPDEQAFQDAQGTEMAQAAWNDVGNYAKTTGTAFWLLTETVIIEPPTTGPGTLEAAHA
ncbi:MAG TPA: EthD family reductase [Rhodoglobus sp.]|nr:EthD family reductase [Rhodoglobus sp.]